jgi:hypothetical protein
LRASPRSGSGTLVAVWRWVSFVFALTGCRFGFDGGELEDAAADDAMVDGDVTGDSAIDGAPITCPGSYIALDASASRYRLLGSSMGWLSAEQACEADGTHLVIVDDAAELSLVAAAIPSQNIWIGVTDRKTVGTFLKVTGGTASYLPWDASEPDAAGLECVFIDSLSLKLADQDCGSGRRAACECDLLPADLTAY